MDSGWSLPPRRWLLRAVLAATVLGLTVAATAAVVGHEPTGLEPGVVERPADNRTVVSIQGFHFQGHANLKKPARLVGVSPTGNTSWIHGAGQGRTAWFYDVDPLPDGNLLVTSTMPGDTLVYELDPTSGERVWTERFDAADTHDVDLLNGDQLLVANMRNYDGDAGVNRDRIFVYDRGTDEIVWEWAFREHFPRSGGGDYDGDWTHVNDVDRISNGSYLVSVRNFDQVVVVNRTTKEITMRLGEDDEYGTLFEQHNPDFLRSADGDPAILVADSTHNRVVEYERENGTWNQTWALTGPLSWPRDADRLPNGNTLVVDSLHQRIVEVTPRGEVVWEYYAAWAPYDAERLGTGDGSNGPTMTDQNVTGRYEVHGGADDGPEATVDVGTWLARRGLVRLGTRYAQVVPFVRPVWVPSWAFAGYVVAGLLSLCWLGAEAVVHRRGLRESLGRIRDAVSARSE